MIWLAIVAVGIVQIPLLVDLVDRARPQWRIGRLTRRSLGYFLLVLLVALCAVALYAFFGIHLPLHFETGSTAAALHTAVAMWLWINALGHYLRTVYTPPTTTASVSASATPSVKRTGRASRGPPESLRHRRETGDETVATDEHCCAKCSETLEAHDSTTHFCRVCKACVVGMDHHCPFTMGCVGRGNFFHFYLFLLHGTVGLAYSSWLSFPLFHACWIEPFVSGRYGELCTSALEIPSLLFVAAVWLGVSTLGLFAFHSLLLLLDMTTLDFNRFWCSGQCTLRELLSRLRVAPSKLCAPSSKCRAFVLDPPAALNWLAPLALPVQSSQTSRAAE
eukprot:m.131790 g.131790  ORF g.131790 m.131790 type:complete len:335 (+) comp9820_c0_seq1:59-1063(+)